MGRGRGKGKKMSVDTSNEDPESGGEESLPAYKRRGRPQKPLKDEHNEEEAEKIEENNGENPKSTILIQEMKGEAVKNRKKRNRYSVQAKENSDSLKEENNGNGLGKEDFVKSNGFRQTGNRRKSKPRRAAEAGVECN